MYGGSEPEYAADSEATRLDLQKELPEEFAIRDAFPNPFNDATDIVFGMPEAGYARMEIYNATGQLIQVLIDGEQRQGYQRIRWEGDDSRGTPVASGVYLIRFEAGGNLQTRKVLLSGSSGCYKSTAYPVKRGTYPIL